MFGSGILDVAIAVVFVFVLVSIVCSAIREGIEAFLKTRASHLEHGIRELLNDPGAEGLARDLFNHPLIYGLYGGGYKPNRPWRFQPTAMLRGRNLPSYIPSRNFALALMDMAARGSDVNFVSSHPSAGKLTFDEMRTNVARLGNPQVQRVLLTALDSAQGDLQKAQANIEAWYDSSMDRVSGWYKRSTQWILFVIAVIVAWTMNIDAVQIAQYLYHEEAARKALVSAAEAAVNNPDFLMQSYEKARATLASNGLPIGWNAPAGSYLGLLLTAFAASLGAPFWFDLLNRIMVIRSTVKPHEKSPEEGSEDRQIGSRQPASGKPVGSEAPASVVINQNAGTPTPNAATGVGLAAPAHPPTAFPDPDDIDGCEVEIQDVTRDDELPGAEGGVA